MEQPLLVKFAEFVDDHGGRLLSIAGTIGMAVCAYRKTDTSPLWIWFIVTCLVFIVGEICTWKNSSRVSKLKRRVSKLTSCLESYRLLFDAIIQQISDRAEFGNTERISIYKHDKNAFVMLGRYSKCPKYNEPGRAVYPDTEGCISMAWNDGEAFENEMPDPERELDEYLERLKNDWGIKKLVARNIKMKSRSWYAKTIANRKGKRIAVIVYESTSINKLDKAKLSQMLENNDADLIREFIATAEPFEPSPSYAAAEGY